MQELFVEIITTVSVGVLSWVVFVVSKFVEQKKKHIYDVNRNTKLREIKDFLKERMVDAVKSRLDGGDFDDYGKLIREIDQAVDEVMITLPEDTLVYLTKHLLRDEQMLRKWLHQIGLVETKQIMEAEFKQ